MFLSSVQMYGSALTFYEEFSDISKLSEEQLNALKALGSPKEDEDIQNSGRPRTSSAEVDLSKLPLQSEKCICLLSRKPLFQAFKDFLMFLFGFCSTPGDRGAIPVERYISFFMREVSCPSLEKPLIYVDLNARKIELTYPSPCSSLPQKLVNFSLLIAALIFSAGYYSAPIFFYFVELFLALPFCGFFSSLREIFFNSRPHLLSRLL